MPFEFIKLVTFIFLVVWIIFLIICYTAFSKTNNKNLTKTALLKEALTFSFIVAISGIIGAAFICIIANWIL